MSTGADIPTELASALRTWAQRYGERPAVIGEQGTLSFAALDRAADVRAGTMRAAGCGRGVHVGLLAGNSPAWLAAAFGVWRSAATLVPISTFVTGRELTEILNDADVEALIVQPRLRSRDFDALLGELPAAARPPRITRLEATADGAGQPGSAPASGREHPEESRLDPESIACILYTSGTTGRAKGVMLSHVPFSQP